MNTVVSQAALLILCAAAIWQAIGNRPTAADRFIVLRVRNRHQPHHIGQSEIC
jgi:hypothetical protein